MKILLNNKVVHIKGDITILQACKEGGVDIPRFCYHERLMIAGNCRMCLVEVEKSVKPLASCAMPVMNGMKVYTNTVMVKKAREGVMELLLANHPLDCPICDQGGECDLQDQAMIFGSDRGRFYEVKRAVVDKDCGVLVKTVMTRCIHCTRCVRFSSELAGVGDFGVTGRGNSMEVSTYVSNIFVSEISGNVIDLCPVGALTSKPYAFLGRSWELEKVESIDIFDGLGSNLSFMVRGNKLMKVLPIINEDINEEWLTDKCRFGYDGFYKQRLLSPMYKRNNQYCDITWEEAFSLVLENMFGRKLVGITGKNVSLESSYAFKCFIERTGSNYLFSENSGKLGNNDFYSDYGMSFKVGELSDYYICLIVGGNLRLECPLLLLRLRRRQRDGDFIVCSIGVTTNYYMDVVKLGNSLSTLISICEGRNYLSNLFIEKSISNKKSLVLCSTHGIGNKSLEGLYLALDSLANRNKLLIIQYLNLGANSVGLSDIGFNRSRLPEVDSRLFYLLDADDLNIRKSDNDFVIYQGHHGDRLVEFADLILPSKINLEQEGLFVNLFGVVQKNNFVLSSVGNTRGDWRIFKNLLDYIYLSDHKLFKVNTLDSLRGLIYREVPFILNQERLLSYKSKWYNKGEITKSVLNNIYTSYYMSDSITRSSSVMAQASKNLVNSISNFRWK